MMGLLSEAITRPPRTWRWNAIRRNRSEQAMIEEDDNKLNRREVMQGAGAIVMASLVAPFAAKEVRYNESKSKEDFMATQSKPSIVFVHGLWADGSCFSKLIPTLQKEGYEVIASQHGLDSHAGDVACVKRTLGQVSAPAILVGHSYGGSVITAAGTDPRVAGLVYLAAFAPDDDETRLREILVGDRWHLAVHRHVGGAGRRGAHGAGEARGAETAEQRRVARVLRQQTVGAAVRIRQDRRTARF